MNAVTNPNRATPRSELRDRIYRAAIAAFRSSGYRQSTIETITERAGVAKGTFFNFYKSKMDVLVAYYQRIDARAAAFRDDLDPCRPVDSLRRYGERMEALFEAEGSLMKDLVSLTRENPLAAIDAASGEADARQFAGFLARAQAAGAIRPDIDPGEAGDLITDLWSGSARAWAAEPGTLELGKAFAARIGHLFRGIGGSE